MPRARESRTAQAVAAERAILTDLGVIDDRFAQGMLNPPMRAVHRLIGQRPSRLPTLPVTLAGLAARVLWHDACVAGSLAEGIRQVVIVGAGYDSRAWRLCREGVTFFEVDHPDTQRTKIHRAPDNGPVFVAADLSAASVVEALSAAGLHLDEPVHYVWEGVTMYLTEEVVRCQLSALAIAAAPGSRMAADFYPPALAGAPTDRRQRLAQALARSGSGEGLRLLLDRSTAAALVAACGWTVEKIADARSIARAMVPSGSGLPVERVSEHKAAILARRR